MKKTALLAAAAALMVATPAMAGGGHVGLSYGSTDAGDSDTDSYQIEGAIGQNNGGWGFQLEGALGQSDNEGGDSDTFTFGGHIYWASDNWRIGGVVATTKLDDDASSSADEMAYGLEGSVNVAPNAVLFGSATFGETEFLVDIDTWNADIGLNYYFSDNFRVGANVGTGNLDAGSGVDFDTTTYGVNAEWQPGSMPLSFTLGFSSFDVDEFLFDDSLDTISIGARWNFGGSTLRERDNQTPFEARTALYQRAFDLR